MTQPGVDTCLFCGEPLPRKSWWRRLVDMTPNRHNPSGPDGDQCWAKFNERMGIDHPSPNPAKPPEEYL